MYKNQISCAIIIFIIGVLYFFSSNRTSKSSKWFSVLLSCSFVQLIFDIFSVYTVNHLDTVSPILNRIVHIIFMGLLLIIFFLVYKYLESIIEEELGEKIKRYSYSTIPLIITLLGLIFLPLSYIENPKSNYSYGPAAFMTYFGVVIYLVFIVRLLLRYNKIIPRKKKKAIYVALLSEVPIAVYQIIVPEALITSLGIVVLNLGIYLTTENPDALLVEQLEKEKRRADNANEAKTNFLANMSHEIRTPITAVLGMNELILREAKETVVKQYAKDVEGAAKSLLSIINDILDITKIEAGKLSIISIEYDFSSVVNDVITMISFKAKMKELKFQVIIDEEIPNKLLGDDIRLRQILVNLLNNAVKYTHEGTVALEIWKCPCDEEGHVRLHFSVRDTGIGIKAEDLKKLCMPFERIEEKRNRNIEGTGLGMSITKQLLNLLGSTLQVSSIYGEGSEFSFELEQKIMDSLPIGKVNQIDVLDEEYEHQHFFEAPEAKILLVDDNEMNRRVVTGLLKATKIQIDEAENGKECLKKVSKNAYDIIFMDHMMPEMDGIEAFRVIKEMEDFPSKNAPVVILTANAIVGAKEKYLEEGFRAFLEKPIDFKKLEDLIEELLDESLLHPVMRSVAPESHQTSELPMIEGLDWKYARTHFQAEQSMMEVIDFFFSGLVYEAKELENLFEEIETEEGRKKYCTKIHSMKNSAATVGIVPLAGMAKVMEDAAREDDVETLKAMTPIFLERWRKYQEHLTVLFPDADKDVGKAAEEFQEDINKILQDIKMAAEDMDIDALDELWKKLEQYQFAETQQLVLEGIHKAIMNFDVDYLQEDENLALWK